MPPLHRLWPSLLIAMCATATAIPAIAVPPTVPAKELALQTWGRREGLPTETFNVIAVDGDGNIWLGSDAGLVMFDGVASTLHTAIDTPQLRADAVITLRWFDGWLWIGTVKGVCRWRDGVFSEVGPELGIPSDQRGRFSSKGPLVAMLGDGAYLWRDGRFVLLRPGRIYSAAALPGGDLMLAGDAVERWHEGVLTAIPGIGYARTVDAGADGTAWFAVEDRGVMRLSPEGRLDLVAARVDNSPALLVDREGSLWFGGQSTPSQRIVPDGRQEVLGGGLRCVADFFQMDDGSMLAASCDVGVARLSAGRFRVLDARSDLPTDPLSVFEDRSGTLWIASQTDPTLLAWKGGEVKRYPLPEPALTHLETRAGVHLVGTPQGLFRIAGAQAEPVTLEAQDPGTPPPPTPMTVTALAETPDDAWWIATLGQGVWRYQRGAATLVSDGELRCSAMATGATAHDLWIGTLHGVYHADPTEPSRGLRVVKDPLLDGAYIVALLAEPDGTLWVGTYESGLVRYRDGKARAITRRQGLPFDSIYIVLADAHGDLWMSGPTGIVRASRAALNAVADGAADRVAGVRVYGTGDGLPVDEATGGMMSASQAPDGRLWFSTAGGVVGVDPRVPDRVPVSPRAVISELSVGATRLPRAGGNVPAEDRDLTVRFSAPTLERAAEVRFRYRLDDLDGDWIDAGTRRIAMYTDLPPGRHHFRVAALAPGATEWGAEASFDLELEARFTETLAFKGLLVALAGLALFGLHRLRTARLRARERTLSRLVDERTSELSAARADLLELNADLERRVDKAVEDLRASERMAAYGQTVAGVAHEVRQPLVALGTTAFVLGQKLRAQPHVMVQREVDLIARETRRMNRVMDELLDFAKPRTLVLAPTSVAALVAESITVFRDEHDRDGTVRIEVGAIDPALVARADAGRVEHVLVNLFANAKKHAHGMTHIAVGACRVGDAIAIDVADDGRGIAPEERARVFEPFVTTGGTGLGLAISAQIAAEHGGSLELVPSERGTTFRLVLPAPAPASTAAAAASGAS